MPAPETIVVDLNVIAVEALRKEEENDHFLRSVQYRDDAELDNLVHAINKEVSAAINCTECGNCCQTLIVNITQEEIGGLAKYLHLSEHETREKHIEESMAGNCFINAVPCTFFADKKCTIYEARFTECRDFPHLHKTGFKARLSGTLMHYGRCPIIYNVIERMKDGTGFFVK